VPEEYVGTKFKTVFARKDPPKDARIDELIKWCRRFAELGLAPGGSGNMSIRSKDGFIVSCTAGNLGLIKAEEFVEVLKADIPGRELTVAGAHEPSSESMMHAAVYGARPEIQAVFHGHQDRLVEEAEQMNLPVTAQEQPYGTPEMANEILKILGKNLFFVMRNHGFVALGESMHETGLKTEEVLARFLARFLARPK
jgi:ribulose-5-phosphate 4-epimerase/fuculose-1-phosphate aldolase